MQRRDVICLRKIIKEIYIGKDLINNVSEEKFLSNEMMKRAVSMTVINIGELVKTLTDEVRENNKHIPWKAMAGMRDITAHRYQTLRMEDVYLAANKELPEIVLEIEKILEKDNGEEA